MTDKEFRAAQFQPFSPLKGYYDMLLEKKEKEEHKYDDNYIDFDDLLKE
ncbi:MAG: hypothetical protein Q4F88_05790 [Eubacteriales bacterium]|nr:hypothetical protein [Eubacteriales bacterium]